MFSNNKNLSKTIGNTEDADFELYKTGLVLELTESINECITRRILQDMGIYHDKRHKNKRLTGRQFKCMYRKYLDKNSN